MTFWSLRQILSLFLDLFSLFGSSNKDKDLEIIMLRQQVRILQRKAKSPSRITTSEKILLGTIASKLTQSATYTRSRLSNVLLLFKPDTVLRWHRKLDCRKWTYLRKRRPGRPCLSTEIEALIIQLARENPR